MSRPALDPYALAVVALSVASSACDNRQAFHEPEPTLERMLSQKRADPFGATSAFADGKVMQHPPKGSIAIDDDSDAPAPPLTRELLAVGRDRFEKTCAVCHGIAGDGVSVVATKMSLRPPPNLHDARYLALSRERLFTIATEGYGLMPGYADMLRADERWAVAGYVQASQLSQHARVNELPVTIRQELSKKAPR